MLNDIDATFHSMYSAILAHGHPKDDRTGVGTLMLPGYQMRFDCRAGRWPILSSRKLVHENPRHEMHMFITGNSSIKYLRDRKIGIWDSWFIPGSAVYDEPVTKTRNVNERATAAIEAGFLDQVASFFDDFKKTYPAWRGLSSVTAKVTDSDDLVWPDLPETAVTQFKDFLTELGISETIVTHTGSQVSLKKRLTRVSKNDSEKWDKLNEVIAEPWEKLSENWAGKTILEDGDDVTIVVYVDGKFEEIQIRPIVAQCLWMTLDQLDVPKYELLDADIGKGSYGVQWRRWQDTQIVDAADFNAYCDKGYTHLGELYEGIGWSEGKSVMHREIDQLKNMVELLKTDPDSRRNIVTAHNPGRVWQAALDPCHLYFQVVSWKMDISELENMLQGRGLFQQFLNTVRDENGHIDEDVFSNKEEAFERMLNFVTANDLPTRAVTMIVVLRSSDAPAGAVFNAAQYAYLLHAIGNIVNMEPDELVTIGVDTHIYNNQVSAIEELLESGTDLENDPRLVFKRRIQDIDDLKFEDVEVVNYVPGPHIHIPIAV